MRNMINQTRLAGTAILISALFLTGCLENPVSEPGASSNLADSSNNAPPALPSENTPEANRAVLSWLAPSTRVNGDDLSLHDLQSYIIRYGRDSDALDASVEVSGSGKPQVEHEFEGLDEGVWYFAIQVVDVNGLISEPSEVVSKQVL